MQHRSFASNTVATASPSAEAGEMTTSTELSCLEDYSSTPSRSCSPLSASPLSEASPPCMLQTSEGSRMMTSRELSSLEDYSVIGPFGSPVSAGLSPTSGTTSSMELSSLEGYSSPTSRSGSPLSVLHLCEIPPPWMSQRSEGGRMMTSTEFSSLEDYSMTGLFGSPVSTQSPPTSPWLEGGGTTFSMELSTIEDYSSPPSRSGSQLSGSPLSKASPPGMSRRLEAGRMTSSRELSSLEDYSMIGPFGSPVSTRPSTLTLPWLEGGGTTSSMELSSQEDYSSMPSRSGSPLLVSPLSKASPPWMLERREVGRLMTSIELLSWGDWGEYSMTGPFGSPVSTGPSPPTSPWLEGGGTKSSMELPNIEYYRSMTSHFSPSPRTRSPLLSPPVPRIKRKTSGGRSVTFINTDFTSFKEVVQEFTGLHSSEILPGRSLSSSAVADVTSDDRTVRERMGIPLPQEKGIVGRAGDKHRIMELILSDDRSSNRVTVICITAADGLGKTTLASLVYRDGTVRGAFDMRGWVCLSEIANYQALLRSIVSSLTGVSCWLFERDELEEILKDELTGKKFLLVLDNVCGNNLKACGDLLPLLSVGDKGSTVMVTTRSNMVAGFLGTRHSYQLEPLMQDSFLYLVKSNFVLRSDLGDIISTAPSKCSGVAMSAKVIRGILHSAIIQQWLGDTLRRKLVEIMSNPDSHLPLLLGLSYKYLRPSWKRCFMFCSLFPKDYTFHKEMLCRLWMSQGFIGSKKGRQEDTFDELFHRSFFDYSPSCDVKEEKYVMHELVSDLARCISGDTFFKAHDHELHLIPKYVHHLSFVPKQYDSDITFKSFIEFRDLSTFILINNSLSGSMDSQFHVENLEALDELFQNLRCLRTLDLSHTDIKELPESIGNLTSLCYLGLNNTNLTRLPDSVCNLSNLQTLELQNSAYLAELPKDIENLANLCHLDLWKETGVIYVPPGIGQLTNLQTLTAFTVGGVSWNCEISELASLGSLKGYLRIQGLENVHNAEDARRACLATKCLEKLSLEWCHSGEEAKCNDRMFTAEQVLHGLEPSYLLGELIIKDYYGREFPSWLGNQFLSKLVSITLDNCYQCEKLPSLGGLLHLRYLFIQKLSGVRFIDHEFRGSDNMVVRKFPSLEMLKLWDMYDLECWHGVMDEDFPSLRSLLIGRCPKLTIIPSFQCISDLSVQSCGKLDFPYLRSLQTLKVDSLKHQKRLVLPSELHALRMLEVTCCDHLSSVEGLTQLQSLEQLKFRSCPKLNFSLEERLPNALQIVDIHHNCYSLRNWRPNGFEELSDASQVRRKFIKSQDSCVL